MLILSIILYALSLMLPGIGDIPGWLILLVGGLPHSLANATWFANPVLFASWIATGVHFKKTGAVLALCALVIAASFTGLSGKVVMDATGIPKAVQVGPGYFLWLMSMLAASLAWFLRLPRISGSYRSLSGRKY
jgi:hypothetical protein